MSFYRRVQLFLGLVRPFEILFLDEVTVSLDVVVRMDLLMWLKRETEVRGNATKFPTRSWTCMYLMLLLFILSDARGYSYLRHTYLRWFGRLAHSPTLPDAQWRHGLAGRDQGSWAVPEIKERRTPRSPVEGGGKVGHALEDRQA